MAKLKLDENFPAYKRGEGGAVSPLSAVRDVARKGLRRTIKEMTEPRPVRYLSADQAPPNYRDMGRYRFVREKTELETHPLKFKYSGLRRSNAR